MLIENMITLKELRYSVHVKHCDGNCTGTTITFERKEGKESSLNDGDHADGCYIILFTEQLTRTFEVLVKL